MNKQEQPLVAIVIPIRVASIYAKEISRLEYLVRTVPSFYEISIIDDGSSAHIVPYLRAKVNKWKSIINKNIRLCRLSTGHVTFSLARARNTGARVSKSPVIMFHDVDFFAPTSIYHKIHEYIVSIHLSKFPKNFFCVPVAFLDEAGSDEVKKKYYFKNVQPSHYTQDEWFSKDRIRIYSLGSSCIVVNRNHLLSVGGYDQRYKGHGGEDFELLHRLSLSFPIAQRPPDYYYNQGSSPIKEYRGFRAYFSLYGKALCDKKISLVHLWHPQRKDQGYYRDKKNFRRLQRTLRSSSVTVGWRKWLFWKNELAKEDNK